MHGLWGMGQMMFTKYLVVLDDDVLAYGVSESAAPEDCCLKPIRVYFPTR